MKNKPKIHVLCILWFYTMFKAINVNSQTSRTCSAPWTTRVNNYPVAEYQFNDRLGNQFTNTAINPYGATGIYKITPLTVQSPYWCQGRVGICLTSPNPSVSGWPVTSQSGMSGMSAMGKFFGKTPLQTSWTIEFWYRKTQNTKPGILFALSNCMAQMSINSNWQLSDCSNIANYQLNTKAFIASNGPTEGFGTISDNNNFASNTFKPTVAPRSRVNTAKQGAQEPASAYMGDSNGLHYYAHIIVPTATYGTCYNINGKVDGASLKLSHDSISFHHSVAEVACDSLDEQWTYGDYIDSIETINGNTNHLYNYLSGESDFVNQELEAIGGFPNYHSLWNPNIPVEGNWQSMGPGCDPNYFREQIAKPNANCNPPNPSSYGSDLNLNFGSYQTNQAGAQFWEGEILYFGIQATALTPAGVLKNWKAGPPNSPPVSSDVAVNMDYCQKTSAAFTVSIFDWDKDELDCSNNVITAIVRLIPDSSIGTLYVGGVIVTSVMLPYTFPRANTMQFILVNTPKNTVQYGIDYTADDGNGGATEFANTATIVITVQGDTPPVANNFSMTVTECNPTTPLFTFPVSDVNSATNCNAILYVQIRQVPTPGSFQLWVVYPNQTAQMVTEAQLPYAYVSTTTFFVTGPAVTSSHRNSIIYNVFDGQLFSPHNSRLVMTYDSGGAPNVTSVQFITIGCQLISNIFTIPITETFCAPIGTISFTSLPSPSQGVLYYNPNTGSTSVFIPITSSTPFEYVPTATYQFHLPGVVRNSYSVRINVNAFTVDTYEQGSGVLTILVGALPLLQQPANLNVQFQQCDLQSSPFQLPTNANNSIYVGCISGLQQILTGTLPNPTTQGTLTVSPSGNINGPFISIASLPYIANYNAYFRFTAPTWNSIDIHYSLQFASVSNYTGIPEFTAFSTLGVYVNASQAKIPMPTVKTSVSVQAGQTIKIDMTGLLGGCASQASTNAFNWLIVALPTAGSSPTQNGSLFFFDPYIIPTFEGARIPSPGIGTTSITGLVNGISGTYSTYINPDPSGELVYAPPFPTNLDTNAQIISTDAFYFFMQYGQRFSVYAGAVKISTTNPLEGISTSVELLENTQVPFQIFGVNVPQGTNAIITSLTGQGEILFHALPIIYPFSIEFAPFTDATLPDIIYRPPANTSGNSLAVATFHMEYTGNLRSPQSYTVTFNVEFVNQPGFFTFVPIEPVYFGANSTVSMVPNNVTQGFNVTLHNTNPNEPIYPWSLSISISSPSTLSVCCLIGNDYYRIIGGAQNSQFIQIYSQRIFLNQFMHSMSFHMLSTSGLATQFIQYSIYDNDPVDPTTTNFMIEVVVVE